MNLSAQVAGAFEPLLAEAVSVVSSLDDEACNRPLPLPETNTVAALVTHAVGSARYWVHLGLTGESPPRDRPAEFRARADRDQLLAALEGLRTWMRKTVAPASVDPAAVRHPAAGGAGEPTTAGECLLNNLGHFATHLGHLQLTTQLLAASGPRGAT